MYHCPRYISEDRRFGIKWIKISLTLSELTYSMLVGIFVWMIVDYMGWGGWWLPLPAGGFATILLMALVGNLASGKPGSYMWDFLSAKNITTGPGAIIRRRGYRCANYEFISPLGIWGKKSRHVGPYRDDHAVVPPSRLMGRFTRIDHAPAAHASLRDIFNVKQGRGRRNA